MKFKEITRSVLSPYTPRLDDIKRELNNVSLRAITVLPNLLLVS